MNNLGKGWLLYVRHLICRLCLNARQPKCTLEKEDAIMQAFMHFGII